MNRSIGTALIVLLVTLHFLLTGAVPCQNDCDCNKNTDELDLSICWRCEASNQTCVPASYVDEDSQFQNATCNAGLICNRILQTFDPTTPILFECQMPSLMTNCTRDSDCAFTVEDLDEHFTSYGYCNPTLGRCIYVNQQHLNTSNTNTFINQATCLVEEISCLQRCDCYSAFPRPQVFSNCMDCNNSTQKCTINPNSFSCINATAPCSNGSECPNCELCIGIFTALFSDTLCTNYQPEISGECTGCYKSCSTNCDCLTARPDNECYSCVDGACILTNTCPGAQVCLNSNTCSNIRVQCVNDGQCNVAGFGPCGKCINGTCRNAIQCNSTDLCIQGTCQCAVPEPPVEAPFIIVPVPIEPLAPTPIPPPAEVNVTCNGSPCSCGLADQSLNRQSCYFCQLGGICSAIVTCNPGEFCNFLGQSGQFECLTETQLQPCVTDLDCIESIVYFDGIHTRYGYCNQTMGRCIYASTAVQDLPESATSVVDLESCSPIPNRCNTSCDCYHNYFNHSKVVTGNVTCNGDGFCSLVTAFIPVTNCTSDTECDQSTCSLCVETAQGQIVQTIGTGCFNVNNASPGFCNGTCDGCQCQLPQPPIESPLEPPLEPPVQEPLEAPQESPAETPSTLPPSLVPPSTLPPSLVPQESPTQAPSSPGENCCLGCCNKSRKRRLHNKM